MAGTANPSALLLKWKLVEGFEMVFIQPPKGTGRGKTRKMGTVANIRDTGKGKVDNRTDQVLMLVTTTTMEENEAPYALQVALLDFKGLHKDILAMYNRKLPAAPTSTPIQLAREQALSAANVAFMCYVCVQVS